MDAAPTLRVEPILILLVDDFEPFRTILREVLERFAEFIVVGEAGDGRAAIELALSLEPQVVIMDVSMPHLGGVEATRRIKRILPGVHVIGVSLNDDPYTQDAMKAAGSSAFLSKNCTHQLPRLIGTLTATVVQN
ncbi:MAG: response regulator transcription factor [Nitrospira sp.]